MAKDKMLVSQIITGQMLIKMTIRNQILSNQTTILSANSTWRREPGMTEFSFVFPAKRRWQQLLEGTACTGHNKKTSRELGLWYPHLHLYYVKPSFKMTICTPTFTAVVPPTAKTQNKEKVNWQIKSERNMVHILKVLLLRLQISPWK